MIVNHQPSSSHTSAMLWYVLMGTHHGQESDALEGGVEHLQQRTPGSPLGIGPVRSDGDVEGRPHTACMHAWGSDMLLTSEFQTKSQDAFKVVGV